MRRQVRHVARGPLVVQRGGLMLGDLLICSCGQRLVKSLDEGLLLGEVTCPRCGNVSMWGGRGFRGGRG